MEISDQISIIDNLTEAVRKHINTHRYQIDLISESSTWNQICSSLDVIGDTVYAIQSYLESPFPDDYGLKYIYTYGLLQALFIQQDALSHLSEAFDIPYKRSDDLRRIRNIRNASIGHPTKQNHQGQRYYNYISRISMTKSGFDLLQNSMPRNFDMQHVRFDEVIPSQLSSIIEGYEAVVKKLEETEKSHMERFSGQSVQDIFHSAMGYLFEKIGEGIYSPSHSNRKFGLAQVKAVRDTYKKFEETLNERNELHEYTKFDLDEYNHALNMLERYMNGEGEFMTEFDARIYLSYLRNEHKGFEQIAKEIDEAYANEKA